MRTGDTSLEARRIEEAAELTAACETLGPHARDNFTRSFDSFDEPSAVLGPGGQSPVRPTVQQWRIRSEESFR